MNVWIFLVDLCDVPCQNLAFCVSCSDALWVYWHVKQAVSMNGHVYCVGVRVPVL